MHLILVRHAHRDISVRSADNGLSDKGHEQAKGLRDVLKNKVGKGAKVICLSSPKKRCVETLEPFAKAMDIKVQVDLDLDEENHSEGSAKFQKRIQAFLERVSKQASKKEDQKLFVFACSHGDWIPAAIDKLLGISIDLKKGGWLEIEDGRLVSLQQPSDYL